MKPSGSTSNSPRTSTVTKPKKEATNESVPAKKKPVAKPKKEVAPPPNNDDDDSVDSKGNLRGFIAYSEEEDDDETMSSSSESAFVGTRLKKATKPRNTIVKNSVRPVRGFKKVAKVAKVAKVESEDEMDVEDEDTETEDSDETYTDSEDPKEKKKGPAEISISFGTVSEPDERHIPKRYNMKKEPLIVKKFVELLTEPSDEGTIDGQIDQFKALSQDKQELLVASLQKKSVVKQENLLFKILTMNISDDTRAFVFAKYNALQSMDPGSGEYFKHKTWLEKFTGLPLGIYKDMPVNLNEGADACGAFMTRAKAALVEAIYGQEESKLQILQFIATRIANPTARGANLLLIGPPGIGKTSLIKGGIAKALGWPFQFISLGGDSDASTYSGHQLVYEGSHTGKIANALIAAKSMSMILMFDELDKISSTSKGEEVKNLMIHMTDTVQNGDFEDKYLSGIALDLSRSMFVFSGNDITKIDKILLDRMIVIQLKGYDKKEKLLIAENYLLPSALKDVNLVEKVAVPVDVLDYIISEYAGKEEGVRELKRCIEQITQKINMLRVFNSKDLPFHIPDFGLPFVVKKAHIDLFLKKKTMEIDPSLRGMYT
jgi:flagellar biosynthesis GTPase FlhF